MKINYDELIPEKYYIFNRTRTLAPQQSTWGNKGAAYDGQLSKIKLKKKRPKNKKISDDMNVNFSRHGIAGSKKESQERALNCKNKINSKIYTG